MVHGYAMLQRMALWRCGAWARGAFGAGVRSWQDYALMRSQALDDGKMLAKCVSQRPTVAGLRTDALLA